jgi:hypothetical protein
VSQVGAAGVLLDAQVAPEDRDAEGGVLVVIVEVAVALGFHSSPFLSPGVAVPLALERYSMAGFGAKAVANHKVSACLDSYHEISAGAKLSDSEQTVILMR